MTRITLKSLDPDYVFWYEVGYESTDADWHDVHDSWIFYRQKIWPCEDGVYAVPLVIGRSSTKQSAALCIRRNADLSDPYTRATYDAIKSGSGAATTALVAELLPTCDDYIPSKDK